MEQSNFDQPSDVWVIDGERMYKVKDLAVILGITVVRIRRAMNYGLRPAYGGERIRLERYRTIDGIRSSLEAVARFHKRLSDPTAVVPDSVSCTSRQQAY